MATGRGTKPSLAGWGLAGIPILATFVQTTLALVGTTLGGAGLDGIQSAIRSIAVFDAAAVLMWQSPAIVGALFVLIAAAWVAQGAAQFLRGNRDLTFAAAGLVSVLFFALFFGVYSPMFGMDVPTAQVAAFFAVPVLASGAAIGSAFWHDWDEKVREEKSAELAEVATDLDRKREAFEEGFDRRIGDLDPLAGIASTGVERARERRREFLDRCDDIEAEIEATRGESPERLRSGAASVERRIEDLDPEDELDRIESDLRERLASGVRVTYGSVGTESRYGRSYELVNLPGRLREVDLSAFDATVHLDRLDEAFLDRIERGVEVRTLAEAVAEAEAHVERIEERVGEREASFAEVAADAESDIETVRAKVERFDGRVGDRVAELAVEGRHDDLPSVRAVEERLAEAKDALHDCRFDDAERAAGDAAADAADLVTLVEFLWSVAGTIDHGGQRVSLPNGIAPADVEAFGPAFETEYGVTFEVTDGAVLVGSGSPTAGDPSTGETAPDAAGTGPEPPGEDPGSAGTESGGAGADTAGAVAEPAARRGGDTDRDGETRPSEQARPEEIVDEVLFVFRELKAAGRASDDGRAQLQTDTLPESVATPAVLSQIERFGQRQTDLLERIDVQENAPPGFVELVPKDGVTVRRAVDALHERYREQYA